MTQEIDDLRKSLMPAIWIFAIIFIFLMVFKVDNGIPHPAIDSISLEIFNKVQHDLLPQNIKILITDPVHALMVQVDISFFFAFVISLPVFLYRMVFYLSPALHSHERKMLKSFVFPLASLFLIGSGVGYYFLVPAILRLLNSYTTVLNATTYYEVNKFISFVILFTFLSGIAFTLPIFMKLSVKFGINKDFWSKNIKYALIFIIAIAFVLSPDLTTTLLVSSVLMSLYALGYYLS